MLWIVVGQAVSTFWHEKRSLPSVTCCRRSECGNLSTILDVILRTTWGAFNWEI